MPANRELVDRYWDRRPAGNVLLVDIQIGNRRTGFSKDLVFLSAVDGRSFYLLLLRFDGDGSFASLFYFAERVERAHPIHDLAAVDLLSSGLRSSL